MKDLHIIVSNKVATYLARDGEIVCGNNDYRIAFTFDGEWDGYEAKTARFFWNGKYIDVAFTGDTVPVPIISGTNTLTVGVYAGELCTTTPAQIPCTRSILCVSGGAEEEEYQDNNGKIERRLPLVTEADDGKVLTAEGGAYVLKKGGGGGGTGADGASAYEIAVKHGFEGSEEEWLKSLEGAPGATGPTGPQGEPGTAGANGKDGTNGTNGKDGADGADGISATHSWNGTTLTITSASGTSSADLKGEKGDKGEQGEQGIQGERGEKGEQGIQGEKGDTGAKGDKGDKGEQGVQGEKGADGKNGTNGTNGTNGKDGKSAYAYAQDGGFTGTEEEFAKMLAGDVLPAYWESYLPNKISAIKALQDEGGKDCFSFIVMTDMHYPSNLGKRSPAIAKRILDKCDIKYALCLGDVQTRGCHNTKELLLAENEQIEKMLSPIRDRLLQTEGNHDGSYGWLDRDGDGKYDNTDKEPTERETYVSNLTPAELHSAIYRKVGLVGDIHFDESGSGYYVDDVANKVRYIILNTQCNNYELQEDGTPKYPKMWLMRFTQPQFDLVIEALKNIPSASWGVVVAGHYPLFQEIGDREIMQGVLNAYKNKTTYSGEYAGTASGGVAYTDLANNFEIGRLNSSGAVSTSNATGAYTCIDYIPLSVTENAIIRIKGYGALTDYNVTLYDANKVVNNSDKANVIFGSRYSYDSVTGVVTLVHGASENFHFMRVSGIPAGTTEEIIITVNEEIKESTALPAYDAVSVNVDFSEAKGELVGYFSGHLHTDTVNISCGFNSISTRCDAKEENTDALKNERVEGTTTEQSFDVFTVNKKTRTINATKIGAGADRVINY